MFFTSLAGAFHMGKKAAEESSQKTKLEKDCCRFSLFPTKIFWAFTNICQRRARKGGGTTWHLINKANKHATQCLRELNRILRQTGKLWWLESEHPNRFRLSVIWDIQSRLRFFYLLAFPFEEFILILSWLKPFISRLGGVSAKWLTNGDSWAFY